MSRIIHNFMKDGIAYIVYCKLIMINQKKHTTWNSTQVSFNTLGRTRLLILMEKAGYIIPFLEVVFMVVLFHYTKFGYDYRALQTGQKIAVGSGVNENQNAIICYATSGLLFGAAGALSVCSTNGVTPTINFSSIASMFSCFLPLFFSGFIMKFCNKQVAIFVGCIAYELIQIGFGQISFADAGFTADVYKVVEAVILVLFLIYLNNENTITDFVTLRGKRASGERSANT